MIRKFATRVISLLPLRIEPRFVFAAFVSSLTACGGAPTDDVEVAPTDADVADVADAADALHGIRCNDGDLTKEDDSESESEPEPESERESESESEREPGASTAHYESLRVVTANLAFRSSKAVKKDWKHIGPEADIVFLQEAKNVRLHEILRDRWAVCQDTSSPDRWGSAVVVRKSAVERVGKLVLVKGTPGSSCGHKDDGIMARWLARVDLKLHNGRSIRATALHMPPKRCQDGPGGPYAVMADNVVEFVKAGGPLPVLGADWNKVINDDPNNIGGRTGLKPRGLDEGKLLWRYDGFYIAPEMKANKKEMRYLDPTSSDHRPVQMILKVPPP